MPRTSWKYTGDALVDEKGRTDAELYLMGVLNGSITAGKKMRKLAKKMLPRIREGHKGWRFDVDKALRPVKFIETHCYMPSGKIGVPMILEQYERMIVELIFGFVDCEGLREFQEALIEVARKNGKTTLCAAINLYMLTSDGEGAPQCYNAASNGAQAALCFGATWKMVQQSKTLRKYVTKGTVAERDATGLRFQPNLGYLITVAGRGDHLDGLDVHYAVIDELAASKDRAVYDLMKQGTSAREQPLIFEISTQGYIRENIWDRQLEYANKWLDDQIEDDRFIGILFELDDREEMWDEEAWYKANPGLGTVKKLETMRSYANKAKNDPSFVPTFLTKDLNLPSNQATAFLTFEEAVNKETFEFDPTQFPYCVLGIDAADTIDLNAATALFMRPGDDRIYRRSMYWIAEEQVKINSNSFKQRDGVPYDEWAARGLIRIVQGNKVDRRVFLDWIQELADEGLYTYAVGYDPWHMDVIETELKMMVGETRCERVRQGAPTLSQPMKQLKADMRDGRIVNNHNPVDEWCNLNLAVNTDTNDNVTPVKKAGATSRIDGYMALICAYITLHRHMDAYLGAIQL